jgi:hypothetical protein
VTILEQIADALGWFDLRPRRASAAVSGCSGRKHCFPEKSHFGEAGRLAA